MLKRNIIPLASVRGIADFPVKETTLRKWKHINKYPKLFTSVGKKVFVDLDEVERLLAEDKKNEPEVTQETLHQESYPIAIDPQASYYDAGGISTMDIIKAKLTPEQFEGFLLGTQLAYLCRRNFKGELKRDSEKAANYARLLAEIE